MKFDCLGLTNILDFISCPTKKEKATLVSIKKKKHINVRAYY